MILILHVLGVDSVHFVRRNHLRVIMIPANKRIKTIKHEQRKCVGDIKNIATTEEPTNYC